MALAPYASYEVVVDGISGDMTDSTTPFRVRRLAADQTTVLLPNSVAVGRGEARALRWTNGATADATQWIRVESAASGVACDVDCGADDRYRVRFFETTASVPRFNNSGGQVTILLLQNLLDTSVDATAYFWDPNGVLLGSQALILAGRQTAVLNNGTVPGTTGQSGAITIAHTAGCGGLSGKTVALDPANGFAFDTPLVYLPR